MRSHLLITIVLLSAIQGRSSAQPIDTVLLSELGRFQFPYWIIPDSSSYYTLSSRIDRLDRPYLYMACVEQGLVTLDISDPASPQPVDTLWPADLGGLKVTNLEQVDDLLYVCLGGFEGAGETAGLAIVDVSDPTSPAIIDIWSDGLFTNGTAIVKVDGDEAYLGAMEDGVIALDVSDPSDIQFLSSYQPDPSWPGIVGYAPNGRGMDIVGDVLYLAYDCGALRALNISDPEYIWQIGQYINPNHPAATANAYNNVVVIGDHAYVTADFCGLEVVNVADPTNMTQVAWLNPWNCMGFSWFGSDGHTNELITAMGDSLLFVSGADSEVLVYDITDPVAPVLKGGHIHPNDSAAAWGVDVHGGLVVANFINNYNLPLQPYYSKVGGVVLFSTQVEFATAIAAASNTRSLILTPNPTDGIVRLGRPAVGGARVIVYSAQGLRLMEGQLMAGEDLVDLSGLPAGIHQLVIQSNNERMTCPVILLGPGS